MYRVNTYSDDTSGVNFTMYCFIVDGQLIIASVLWCDRNVVIFADDVSNR